MAIELWIEGEEADIYVYKNARGVPLATDHINELNQSDRIKITRLLQEYGARGIIRNSERFRLEKKPIFAFKSYQTRILCFFLPGKAKRTLVLTHSFTKKQDRMPKDELTRALNIYKEIMESL